MIEKIEQPRRMSQAYVDNGETGASATVVIVDELRRLVDAVSAVAAELHAVNATLLAAAEADAAAAAVVKPNLVENRIAPTGTKRRN